MADGKTQRKLDKLEKLLSKGMFKYVLYYGVLGWGLTTAILVSAVNYFIYQDSPKYFHFIAFPLMGIFWGGWMWSALNKKYKKLKAQQ